MARVRFLEDFDYRPRFGVTIAYKAGMEETVRRECAEQAKSSGKAIELRARKPQSEADDAARR